MYFSQTDKITYGDFIVTDITRRTNIIQNLIKNEDFYFDYELVEGDTPESIAHDNYGDVDLHWIIMMINEVYDPFYQWYMTYKEVIEYSKLKYGDPDYTYVQYWELDDVKYKTNPGGLSLAVSNLDYEVAVNDAKRKIRVVYPEYTNQIVREFKGLVVR